MLAKLFSDISLSSLIRALAISLVISLVLAILFAQGVDQLNFIQNSYEVPGALYKILFAIIVFGSSWWFNSSVNSLGFLKFDYQLIPVMSLLLAPTLLRAGSMELLLIMPLGLTLIIRLMSIADSPRYSFILFDSGTIIGIMMLISPEMVLFIIPTWMAIVTFGRLYLRALLMPLIGTAAVLFMAFTITYWIGGKDLANAWMSHLLQVDFGFCTDWAQGWWRFIPLMALLLAASYQVFQVYTKANVLKRQCFSFLLLILLIFLMGGAFVENYNTMWVWLSIPISVFLVNLLHYLPREWMKDLVYVFLVLYFVLSLIR